MLSREEEVEGGGRDDHLCTSGSGPVSALVEPGLCFRHRFEQRDPPTLGSSLASLRVLTMLLIDSLVPFLPMADTSHHDQYARGQRIFQEPSI